MLTRTQSLALLLLAAAPLSSKAQELVVVVELPVFILDTRLSAGSTFTALVATAESPAFKMDTRLVASSDTAMLVVTATSPVFTLDTRLSSGPATSTLVVTVESPTFALATRLSGGNPILSALVVTAESAAFRLDTRLVGKPDYLIVEAVSSAFELNTMWIGIRRTAHAAGSLVELYWPTNAPGFYPQSALPPLRPSMQWQDMTNSVSESEGFYRTPLSPEGTDRYFRLKL